MAKSPTTKSSTGEKTSGKVTKASDILDAAERFARTLGYNGFSFRDVASEVGIKSASVHYHFPTKADLGAAVAVRYADRFFQALGNPEDPDISPDALLARYRGLYRHALVTDQQMCLCGMLGAEVASLPPEVASEVMKFFERNLDWLARVVVRLGDNTARDAERHAMKVLAALEGALMLARTLGRNDIFDQVAEDITRP